VDLLLRDVAAASAAIVGRIETGDSPAQLPGERRQIRLIVVGVLRDMGRQLA